MKNHDDGRLDAKQWKMEKKEKMPTLNTSEKNPAPIFSQ